MIVNLSVWESIEALEAFTFGDPAHRAVLRGRRAWFEPHAEADTALWWIAGDTLPSVEDAAERLAHLRRHGPTAFAFTFRQRFAPGAATAS